MPSKCPAPDLNYLNLHAVRRMAFIAQCTQTKVDWTYYKKVDSALFRHAHRLRLLKGREICEPLDAHLPSPQAWRVAQSLLLFPVTRHTNARFPIVIRICLP